MRKAALHDRSKTVISPGKTGSSMWNNDIYMDNNLANWSNACIQGAVVAV